MRRLVHRPDDVGLKFFVNSFVPELWISTPDKLEMTDQSLAAYLAQLEEEGYAKRDAEGLTVAWADLYDLLNNPEHLSSAPLLGLPEFSTLRPALVSQGALSDSGFSIYLDGWRSETGQVVSQEVIRTGAQLKLGQTEQLLPEPVWLLIDAVRSFARRPVNEKNRDAHFAAWGRIRALADEADALLDRFLETTIVLTPEALRLELSQSVISGVPVVEVLPTFENAPTWWLDVFDSHVSVPPRYDHTQPGGGIVHIVIALEVRQVLAEIKAMPGRRVAGERAEAFLRNPYAVLGEAASAVIPPGSFEQARTQAGVVFYTFQIALARHPASDAEKAGLIERVEIQVAPQAERFAATELLHLPNPQALQTFIDKLERGITESKLCFVWAGRKLELDPNAQAQLDQARSWLIEWQRARVLISASEVYDLSGYAPRVEGIGAAKPVYSPYIMRMGGATSWLPDKVEVGIAFKPQGGAQTLLLPFSKDEQANFGRAVDEAVQAGKTELNWPGLPAPISLGEAHALKADVDLALSGVKAGGWKEGPPTNPVEKLDRPNGRPPSLLTIHNIDVVDYSEARQAALSFDSTKLRLPESLKPGEKLLPHQQEGLAWLLHLWAHSPEYARGGLLADDMGLGKTLQLLAFLSCVFEINSDSPPALVVAPVALLDNWQREIEHFFQPDTFRVMALHGSTLSRHKAKKDEIDDALLKDGLKRFLQPGWQGEANLILTTYETLRDFEFSLAREKWSVMICDEAQKIKSPAALVTHAAKAMHARFKIAATGTPVENSLTDLWCLFDFIQPGLLGALNEFGRKYKRPIEANTDKEKDALEELQALFAPQLLRRTKDEVVKLPPKMEDMACRELPISELQRQLYAQALSAHKEKIATADSKRVGQAMLGMLHQLKVLCAHPIAMGQTANLHPPLVEALRDSPKLAWLMAALERIEASGEKAIVFTELREIQRVLQHYIGENLGKRPAIVNGDTDVQSKSGVSRQNLIDAFQKQPGFNVIILSTQAVGFGLNIQAANHVIHYTRPWNPAKEDQATDRAYRIGQDKPVTVYYPTVHADFVTFEKRLDELLTKKREIAAKTWLNGADDIRLEEFGNFSDAAGETVLPDRAVSEDELIRMDGHAFEAFCALLWSKQGFQVHRTPVSGDGGVDVVAIRDGKGILIQCKSTSRQDQALGWDAVKEVASGATAYQQRYPGVSFKRMALTNQSFNLAAQEQAKLLEVELWGKQQLLGCMTQYPVQYCEWLAALA
jgi:Holliday junction resolvase